MNLNRWNYEYHKLLENLINNGYEHYDDSRKINTKALFGYNIRLFLEEGFPAITTKKLAWKSVVSELIWFLRGDTNIKYLLDNNNPIWNKDAYSFFIGKDKEEFERFKKLNPSYPSAYTVLFNPNEFIEEVKSGSLNGDLGPVYGAQWRRWGTGEFSPIGEDEETGRLLYEEVTIDQIQKVVDGIKNKPNDRGHIISAWNVGELKNMALRPCHIMAQFNVRGEYLDCLFFIRSNDTFLGLPFNMASYALLQHIICYLTDKKVGQLVYNGGNVHLYENHIEVAKEQLTRDINMYQAPKLKISGSALKLMDAFKQGKNDIQVLFNSFEVSDFELVDYNSYPPLKGDMISKIF
jgi:thymidylate synthase